MTDADLFEQARIFLPKYLSPEKQEDLWRELKSFPENRSYYSSDPQLRDQLLQGDGWRGFVVIDFYSLERKKVSGVILSNSCDIAPENPRMLVPNILFVPLIRLDSYGALLRQAGTTSHQIEAQFDAIRKQRVSSIFYLPPHAPVMPESIAVLHDVHSQPLNDFSTADRESLFTLNLFAFYLFLLKISIHLTRMQEDVVR